MKRVFFRMPFVFLVPYVVLLVVLVVCSIRSQTEEPTGEDYFYWATGLDLPEGITCLNDMVLVVEDIKTTYYLKLTSQRDLTEFMTKNFKRVDWDTVKKELTDLPHEWWARKGHNRAPEGDPSWQVFDGITVKSSRSER